jgi:uncharacterized protein (TIGR03000 family)
MARFFLPGLLVLGLWVLSPFEAEAKGPGGGGGRGGGHGGGHGAAHHGGGHGGGHRVGGFGGYGAFGFYSPYFYGAYPGYYNNYSYSAYPPSYDYVTPLVPPAPRVQPIDPTVAQIDVVLPRPDAKVWVDGNLSGAFRSFASPSLEPGYSYSYRVTASWTDNGREVRVERSVPVSPGRLATVDFTKVNTMPPAGE